MDLLDFSFDLSNRYTVWTGILGGTFLMLSYFGTDQSQVQRYLSGKNVREMRLGLIFNGLLKIPMQFFILLVGVMVFVFYQFNATPANFNPTATQAVYNSEHSTNYKLLELDLARNLRYRKAAAFNLVKYPEKDVYVVDGEEHSWLAKFNAEDKVLRNQAKELIAKADPKVETNDKDYVFIHFILNNLPKGLIGLLLAVILSAAMSSTASELNALGATTAIDLYRRNVKDKDDAHYVKATKGFTLLWGVLAIIVACTASLFENLIELVNIIGSIFYGNILGIFLLAFFFTYVKGNAVFISALITQVIICVFYGLIHFGVIEFPYLWLNVIGSALVIGIAFLLQTTMPNKPNTHEPSIV